MEEKPLSTLDILKMLPGSNCKDCQLATCMAFAALVYQGQRNIDDCPHLDQPTSLNLQNSLSKQKYPDWTGEDVLRKYKSRLTTLDLNTRAELLGGWMQSDRLTLHCLGKLFQVDQQGDLHSECHQNPWLHVPLLSYVLDSEALEPKGNWVRFDELKKAKAWIRFFKHSCQDPIQRLCTTDPELALDILDLFCRDKQLQDFEADRTFLLFPLPKVPILFAYTRPQEGFSTGLSVYLDKTADNNLDPESLFRLGRGMAEMFKRIAQRHGHTGYLG